MVTRLTVDEFFEALHERNVYPLVDSSEIRENVEQRVRRLCVNYPIKDRWPVLDLESAYEGYLNAQSERLLEWHRNGYGGTISAGKFNNVYTLDEWFGDFTQSWNLDDNTEVRAKMLALLPQGNSWKSPELFAAHCEATKYAWKNFLLRLFG